MSSPNYDDNGFEDDFEDNFESDGNSDFDKYLSDDLANEWLDDDDDK